MHGKLQPALIIFARRPLLGKVKTRLTPPLSSTEAAELYRCMLFDTLTKTTELSGVERLLFYVDDPGAAAFFRDAVNLECVPQKGSDLGERMEQAFATAFARGRDRVAIIGTDSPDLPLTFIQEAFARLDRGDIDALFGPSADGGYYLLALKRLHPELFRGIRWSSDRVLEESMKRGTAAGITVSLLPPWYDVDTVADLERPGLRDEANGAPLTREFIKKMLE